ncbi:MAG: alpha/beta fold hydrolase [Actinomycetota bacterium]
MKVVVRHRSIDVGWGVVHAREAGVGLGRTLVCVHQTPRSGDEFAELLDELGGRRHVVALDLPGMGHSSPHPDGASIPAYAAAVASALDSLGRPVELLGHHTGAAVVAELAATSPQLVDRLMLSSPPWLDAEQRAAREARPGPGVDEVTPADDGAHLMALWRGRMSFYPDDRADLLERFVSDALLTADPHAGHRAVAQWVMEDALPGLGELPVVLVDHVEDPFAHPWITRWQEALPLATTITVDGGMVPFELTGRATARAIDTLG